MTAIERSIADTKDRLREALPSGMAPIEAAARFLMTALPPPLQHEALRTFENWLCDGSRAGGPRPADLRPFFELCAAQLTTSRAAWGGR
ncbi:MAG: hypothetical protein L6R00_06455 [Phycisphaerae bacterium]|nr:hypothetical protein [Phycisphaerae bacterium]